jgi:hypothetical protein
LATCPTSFADSRAWYVALRRFRLPTYFFTVHVY